MYFKYDDISIGINASYEFNLYYKLASTDIPSHLWPIYLIHLRNSLIAAIAGRKILETRRPDRLVVYNNLYSTNHVMVDLAESMGIYSFGLHAGSHHRDRVSEITIFRGNSGQALVARAKSWERYRLIGLSSEEVRHAYIHIREMILAKSPWVYSVAARGASTTEIRNFFGVQSHQKVLLATMASGDEQFCYSLVASAPDGQRPMTEFQVEWLNKLIQWVGDKPDLFLIIRVHPREFPNKREAVISPHVEKYKAVFQNLPKNIIINWPTDNISMYDLFKIVDVGLNNTSSAGLEMMCFGIPIVEYDSTQLFAYPVEFSYDANSSQDYFSRILKALDNGKDSASFYKACQWLEYRSNVIAIDISDGFEEYVNQPIWYRFYKKIRRIILGDNPLQGLKNKTPLKNTFWLSFAIEAGLESHMDEFSKSIQKKSNKTLSDGRLTAEACFRELLDATCHKEDLINERRECQSTASKADIG